MRAFNGISKGFTSEHKFAKFLNVMKTIDKMYFFWRINIE